MSLRSATTAKRPWSQYMFTDQSRFEDRNGNVVGEPDNDSTSFQLTMVEKKDGEWVVKRLITGDDSYR